MFGMRRSLRHIGLAAAATLGAGAAMVLTGFAGPAAAVITNPSARATYYADAGGRCTTFVGSVPQWTTGWAMGGVDIECDRPMKTLSAKVTLLRWNGSNYAAVTATAWEPRYSLQNYSLHTPAYCGGGYTQWIVRASVYIERPDGSVYSYPPRDWAGSYAPGRC